MDFSYQRRTVSRRENGTELIRAAFVYPSDLPAVGELAAQVESFVDSTLLPWARDSFFAEPAPNKRFSFRRFEYAFSVTAKEGREGIVELTLRAQLARAQGEMLGSHESTRFLRLSDGLFVPHKIAQKKHRKVLGSGVTVEHPKNSEG